MPSAFKSYLEIVRNMPTDDQKLLFRTFLDSSTSDVTMPVLQRLADNLRFRLPSVTRRDKNWQAAQLAERAAAVIPHDLWQKLVIDFYVQHRRNLLQRFLDACGIPNQNGLIGNEEIPSIDDERLQMAVMTIVADHDIAEVRRYLSVLTLAVQGRLTELAKRALPMLSAAGATAPGFSAEAAPTPPVQSADDDDEIVLVGTQLDRVIIQQVIASVQGIQGAPNADEIDDLIETVLSLNASWHGAYYALGLLDRLSKGREPQFDRAEMNVTRTAWYVAGIVAAAVRLRAGKEAIELVRSHIDLLTNDGTLHPRAAILRIATPVLLEAPDASAQLLSRLLLACVNFRGTGLPASIAEDILRRSAELIQARDVVHANPLLLALKDTLPFFNHKGDQDYRRLSSKIERRLGQCRGLSNHFEPAREHFQRALSILGPSELAPDLETDVGLAKGEFATIADIVLADDPDGIQGLCSRLAKGESEFLRAVQVESPLPTNARFAIACLEFLRITTDPGNAERHRQQARDWAILALTGMEMAPSPESYDRTAARQSAWLIEAIARYELLDSADAPPALSRLQMLAPYMGDKRIARGLLRRLYQAVLAVGGPLCDDALRILREALGNEALTILEPKDFARGTPDDLEWCLQAAATSNMPLDEQQQLIYKILEKLRSLPTSPQVRDLHERAIDALEASVNTGGDSGQMENWIDWLAESRNWESAWTADEAMWARVRSLTALGQDARAIEEVRTAFHRAKSQAAATEELQGYFDLFSELNLDAAEIESLRRLIPARLSAPEAMPLTGAERNQAITILFVGGDQRQSRWADDIRKEVREDYPNATIDMRFTGWSSNWGRELDDLIRARDAADVMVLMTFMRTQLGRGLREGSRVPWRSCTTHGKSGMISVIKDAAALAIRSGKGAAQG